ncbi:MAG: hypothetical protein LBL97_00860 [Prevotellaceae bacterium]|jgi:hypothetical protein|nr:hypothetical protein [Prevotellaceae bacterium]
MIYYVVKYSGTFGFIKPWTAVRDLETFSQQFLTPSIVEGIEKKLFPELLQHRGISKIVRHKLSYAGVNPQQETIQAKAWKKSNKMYQREKAVLIRGVLLYPSLLLAFAREEDAQRAACQHICLCRNEDLLFPDNEIMEMCEDEFNRLDGYELRFGESDKAFMVGYNQYDDNSPMYGAIEITGTPIRKEYV